MHVSDTAAQQLAFLFPKCSKFYFFRDNNSSDVHPFLLFFFSSLPQFHLLLLFLNSSCVTLLILQIELQTFSFSEGVGNKAKGSEQANI